jgi:mRNA-degrading endonuclease toxin of MazEF toxin-antitoxin module
MLVTNASWPIALAAADSLGCLTRETSGVRRRDLVAIRVGGDDGTPRPTLAIEADAFGNLPSVTVLRLTTEIRSQEGLVPLRSGPRLRSGRVTSRRS